MALVKKTITMTERQEQWIRAQVASGDYGSDSEYFRTLIVRILHAGMDASRGVRP